MEYTPAPDVDQEIQRIIASLRMDHLDAQRIRAIRSRGTQSRRILARCHTLPKALQTALGLAPHYVIELLAENFEPLPESEKTKTLIHELLHIPSTFGGGFRNHSYVRAHRVNRLYRNYLEQVQITQPATMGTGR